MWVGRSTGGPEYTYVAVPSVESITPSSGATAGGTSVKIKGSGFVAPATVKIGSAATEVKVVSETEITAKTVATAAGVQEVIVTDAGGTSTLGPKYTFVAVPSVESVSPDQGPVAGGTKVTIKGKGFLAGSSVTIGGAASEVKVVSETEITAKTVAGSAGVQEVVVTDVGGPLTGGPEYTYVAVPSVESITPSSGATAGGTSVKIKGSGFVAPATVKIGSAATEVKVVSETEITAKTVATAAGVQEVIVTDAGGTSTLGPKYTFVAVPSVESVSPDQGPTAGGTAVKIKGKGFLAGSTVTIGSSATSVVVVSETEITAKTAAGAAGGQEVVVTDVGGSLTGGPEYTYVAVPGVESIAPTQGATAGGTKVTIKGTGFVAGATVTIGSAATSVVVKSETEVTATTAAHAAGAQEVVVSDAGGTSTLGPSYTYIPPPIVTLNQPTSPSKNTTPSFTGTASDSTLITVKIYAGATVKGSVVSTATATGTGGSWSSGNASPALEDGQYTATATQEGLVGNPAGVSPPVTFTVDTEPPTVTLEAPARSKNLTPSFKGTASESGPAVTVEIYKGSEAKGTPVATATAAASRAGEAWSSGSASPALEAGNHTFTAVAVEPAGSATPKARARKSTSKLTPNRRK